MQDDTQPDSTSIKKLFSHSNDLVQKSKEINAQLEELSSKLREIIRVSEQLREQVAQAVENSDQQD